MTTTEFITLLAENQGKSLIFEYAPGMVVGTDYHITEVKHITVESVDCGAGTDSWKETIIQLWESPTKSSQPEHMSAYKALGILKKVGQMKAYQMDAEVKIEYSNAIFHTTQLHITGFNSQDKLLIIKLAIQPTDCKAKDACGVPETMTETTSNTCNPGSGCC